MGGARQAVFVCFVLTVAFLTYLFGLVVRVSADGFPVERVFRSIVRVDVDFNGQPGHCTAFSVSDDPPRYITAAHCVTGLVTVGTLRFLPLEIDVAEDVALLEGEASLPALAIGSTPKTGDPTMAIGFPLSSTHPMGLPSIYQGVFAAWGTAPPMAIFAGNTIPGMSGGPIVNRRGDVVSVVLGGGKPDQHYQNIGVGAKHAALRRLVESWRGRRTGLSYQPLTR